MEPSELLKNLPPGVREDIENKRKLAEMEAKMREQEAIINSLLEVKSIVDKQQAVIDELNKEVKKRDTAINSLTTAGIDITKFPPIEEIEDHLNISRGVAETLLQQDQPYEYIKMIYKQYDTLLNEKAQAFEAEELTFDGRSVAEQMNQSVKFFEMNPTMTHLATTKPELYAQNTALLIANWRRFVKWQEIQSAAVNVAEAFAAGMLHYTYKEIKTQGKKEMEFAFNPEIELQKQAEKAAAKEAQVQTEALQKIQSDEAGAPATKGEIKELKAQNESILKMITDFVLGDEKPKEQPPTTQPPTNKKGGLEEIPYTPEENDDESGDIEQPQEEKKPSSRFKKK